MEIATIDDAKLRPCPLCGGTATAHSPYVVDGYIIIRCTMCGFSSSYSSNDMYAVEKWNARPRVKEVQKRLRFAEAVAEEFIHLTPPYFIQFRLKDVIDEWREIQNNEHTGEKEE